MRAFNLHKTILYLLGILPITTLFVFQSITNKVLFVGFMLCFAVILLERIKVRKLIFLMVLAGEFALSLYITHTLKLYNLNDIFYLPLWILMLMYLNGFQDEFKECVRQNMFFLKLCVLAWSVIYALLLILYPAMNGESAHRSASSAFMIIVFVFFISKETDNKLFNLWMLPPFVCVFMMEARTYLIVSLIVGLMSYYSVFKKKIYYVLTVVPVLVLTVVFVLNTSAGDRFVHVGESYYGGFWAAATSTRSVFWAADLKAFWESDLFHKIFGSGYNFIYEVNMKAINTCIWGHNDIIHILGSNGIFGVILYLAPLIEYLRSIRRSGSVDGRLFVLALGIILACMLLDGLYHYFCAAFSMPFLFLGIRKRESLKELPYAEALV